MAQIRLNAGQQRYSTTPLTPKLERYDDSYAVAAKGIEIAEPIYNAYKNMDYQKFKAEEAERTRQLHNDITAEQDPQAKQKLVNEFYAGQSERLQSHDFNEVHLLDFKNTVHAQKFGLQHTVTNSIINEGRKVLAQTLESVAKGDESLGYRLSSIEETVASAIGTYISPADAKDIIDQTKDAMIIGDIHKLNSVDLEVNSDSDYEASIGVLETQYDIISKQFQTHNATDEQLTALHQAYTNSINDINHKYTAHQHSYDATIANEVDIFKMVGGTDEDRQRLIQATTTMYDKDTANSLIKMLDGTSTIGATEAEYSVNQVQTRINQYYRDIESTGQILTADERVKVFNKYMSGVKIIGTKAINMFTSERNKIFSNIDSDYKQRAKLDTTVSKLLTLEVGSKANGDYTRYSKLSGRELPPDFTPDEFPLEYKGREFKNISEYLQYTTESYSAEAKYTKKLSNLVHTKVGEWQKLHNTTELPPSMDMDIIMSTAVTDFNKSEEGLKIRAEARKAARLEKIREEKIEKTEKRIRKERNAPLDQRIRGFNGEMILTN